MFMSKRLLLLLGFGLLLCGLSAQQRAMHHEAGRQNAPQQLDKPYVILISLDGYRWDYTARFQPPNLSRLIAQGVQAEGLIPCFPSKTYPNHYSIATGMTPERHNLVDNSYFDPEKGEMYTMSKRRLVEDGSWYGGIPIWVQAEKEGMVSASFFFVGSEADIQGIRPTYWYTYDGSVPEMIRVQQALDWLRLPAEIRPHLISMYFSNMDDAGHRFGPNNDAKLSEALMSLDTALGRLFDGVDSLGLPVHFIIVSDHGMAEVAPEQFLPIDPLLNDSLYTTANNGALAHFYLRPGADPDSVFQALQARATHARIYKTQDFPHYHNNIGNPRLGDFIALPDFPYYYSDLRRMSLLRRGGPKGEHGFDPAITDLHGIFYAQGPLLKSGLTLPRFQNVHIYPLICRLLGLSIPPDIDGRPEVLAPALR